MPQDLSLFGDDEKSPSTEHSQLTQPRASASSVDLIRRALDAHGLVTMSDRQLLIERHVGRPVESLRALTETEALLVLSKLGRATGQAPSAASSWDDRDDDTWIDRL